MKSDKKQFTLNPANPRERVISDFLKTQFNMSDFIKDVLYQYIISNNLNTNIASIQQDVVINTVPINKDIRKNIESIQQDAIKSMESIQHDNGNINDNIKQIDSNDKASILKEDLNNDDFSIDINNINDEEVNMSNGENGKSATDNAMNFILNM